MKIISTMTREIPYWAIKESSRDKKLNSMLSSGDKIIIGLSNKKEMSFTVGRDSSNTYLISDECISFMMPMADSNKSLHSWRDSKIREWLNNEFYTLLLPEVQDIIKTTVIQQQFRGMNSQSRDKIFIPSLSQVYGEGAWSDIDTGCEQIDIFKNPKNRVRFLNDKIEWWWSRTPHNISVGEMRFGICNDVTISDVPSNKHGIVPMFRI